MIQVKKMRDIRKRRITILIIAAAAMIMASAAYAMTPSGVSDIEVLTSEGERIEESYDLYIGESVQLACRIRPKTFSQRDVEYRSADEEILTVDESGLLTGKSEGQTRLLVECAGFRKSLIVDVEPGVEAIKGLGKEITLSPGDEYQLEPEVVMADKDLETPEVTYKSKRTTVAAVDNKGKVTAVSEGTTRITVKAGTESVKIKVIVEEGAEPVVIAAPASDNNSTADRQNKTTAKKKTTKKTKTGNKKRKTTSESQADDSGSGGSTSETVDSGDNGSGSDSGSSSSDSGDSGSGTGDSSQGGSSESSGSGDANTGSDSSTASGSDPNSQTDADLTADY